MLLIRFTHENAKRSVELKFGFKVEQKCREKIGVVSKYQFDVKIKYFASHLMKIVEYRVSSITVCGKVSGSSKKNDVLHLSSRIVKSKKKSQGHVNKR